MVELQQEQAQIVLKSFQHQSFQTLLQNVNVISMRLFTEIFYNTLVIAFINRMYRKVWSFRDTNHIPGILPLDFKIFYYLNNILTDGKVIFNIKFLFNIKATISKYN